MVNEAAPVASVAQKLFDELDILNKILYRNNNQHGRTKIFAPLKAIKRQFNVVSLSRICLVDAKTSEALTSHNGQINDAYMCSLALCFTGLELVCVTCKKTSHLLNLALLSLTSQLRKRVFASLFSMLLAVASRIFTANNVLLRTFEKNKLAVENNLKEARDMLRMWKEINPKLFHELDILLSMRSMSTLNYISNNTKPPLRTDSSNSKHTISSHLEVPMSITEDSTMIFTEGKGDKNDNHNITTFRKDEEYERRLGKKSKIQGDVSSINSHKQLKMGESLLAMNNFTDSKAPTLGHTEVSVTVNRFDGDDDTGEIVLPGEVTKIWHGLH